MLKHKVFISENKVDLNKLPNILKEAILSFEEIEIDYESKKDEHSEEAQKVLAKMKKASDLIYKALVDELDDESVEEESAFSTFFKGL